MITTDDKVYNQLVDDLFTGLDKEVGTVVEGLVPKGAAPLKLYRLSISPTEYSGYRSCIVVAESEWHARRTHPSGCSWDEWDIHRKHKAEWVTPRYVKLIDVQEVGTANADQVPGVLCTNYVQLQ